MCVLVYLSSSSSVADKSFIRSTFCQLSAMSFFGWRWWCFSWMHLNTKTPSLRLYLVGRVYLLSYLCRETMSMMKRKKYIRAEKWAWQQIISNFGKIKRCTTMTPHKPWIISGFIQQQSFLLVKYGAWWPACSFILSPFPLFSPSTSPWMRKCVANACICNGLSLESFAWALSLSLSLFSYKFEYGLRVRTFQWIATIETGSTKLSYGICSFSKWITTNDLWTFYWIRLPNPQNNGVISFLCQKWIV